MNPKHASWHLTHATEVTRAAETGKRHVVTHLSAGFADPTTSGTLLLKQGTTTRFTFHVHGSLDVNLPTPIEFDLEQDVVATLAEAGAVNMSGYTV